MFQKITDPGEIARQSGEMWLAKATYASKKDEGKKEKIAMTKIELQDPTETPTSAQIEKQALEFARKISSQEVVNKLKALETAIDGARDREEVRYLIARAFPRFKDKNGNTKEALNGMLTCLSNWELKDFKKLFHFTRVFFEARKEGMKLPQPEIEGGKS